MRRGFLLAMLGLATLALTALLFIAPRRGTTSLAQGQGSATVFAEEAQPAEAQARDETNTNLAGLAVMPPARPFAVALPKEGAAEASAVSVRDEQYEARVAARVAELGELSAKSDGASLATLLAEVRNPEQEIREAALDAITQSGNRAAIPGLREAAALTEDPRDKQAIVDVIEFMSLPTLTEVLSGRSETNIHQPAPRSP